MPAAAVALVLLSAALHAGWNALLKRDADPRDAALAVVAVAAAAALLAAPLFPGRAFPAPSGAAWSAAAGAFETAYFWTLARALAGAPLGVAYPVARGGALVLLWPVSVLWLGERAGLAAAGGAALVCAGIAAAAFDGRRAPGRGAAWAVACAATIAAYTLCYKQALRTGADAAAVTALSLGVALAASAAARGRPGVRAALARVRARPAGLVAAGLAAAGSFVLFLLAMRLTGAAAASTLRNVSIVFAQVLALALGEHPPRRQWLGAAAIVAGAALLGRS